MSSIKMGLKKFLYSVGWSEEDEAFIARVAEFPSLAAHGDTQEDALREIKEVVRCVLSDLKENKEPIPEPLGKRSFRGRLVLRMPDNLHRKHALATSQE